MPEESSKSVQGDAAKDHFTVRHPEGKSEKFPLPEGEGTIIKVGRELDNDLVLTDPRSSRHHAEFRRTGNIWEVRDLDSANGTFVNNERLEPDTWTKITPRQTVTIAETRIVWEQNLAAQSTVEMKRPRDMTVPSAVPPPVVKPSPAPAPTPAKEGERPQTIITPWAIGIGLVVLLLIIAGLVLMLSGSGDGGDLADQQPVTFQTPGAGDGRGDGSLEGQSLGSGPTSTPTPSGPQLAIPVLEIVSSQVSPIIFGASPNTTEAYIFIDVRARNAGNIPFEFSISNFSMRTRDGQTFSEAGSSISENYLRQLGAIDRFEDLALTPGGSVPGSLVFQLEIGTYDLELVFEAPDLDPVYLSLGTINMDRELKIAAGTPAAVYDEAVVVPTTETETEPTATVAPTPTPTRPALIPAPAQVSRSALAGTIAYASFDGESYNIYFGDVESGESTFFRSQASQPAFSPDGSRIAFHSWDDSSRGLMTMDVSGANGIIVANFLEDQLPTWTADGDEIVLLSRRSGDRKSNLIKVGSRQERTEGVILGEGEYPTIGQTGRMVFKGWGTTAFGLRSSTDTMGDIESITSVDGDTAPALSPDGEKVVFMSQREENWDIYVADADGSNLQRLTDDAAQDGIPTWSPDGNAIAFVSDRGGIWAIWVMTPDGNGKSQLFTMPGSADGFVGSPSSTDATRGWAEERISWIR
ncbi:MAG TPA: FHA domain-containing protein [Anaerolineae bacterium]|nr:PD40 domain-containing protein [Anaerolineae bacterium]HRV91434.1 FHA domain-containing protein [Anaerolineae bacterium]